MLLNMGVKLTGFYTIFTAAGIGVMLLKKLDAGMIVTIGAASSFFK